MCNSVLRSPRGHPSPGGPLSLPNQGSTDSNCRGGAAGAPISGEREASAAPAGRPRKDEVRDTYSLECRRHAICCWMMDASTGTLLFLSALEPKLIGIAYYEYNALFTTTAADWCYYFNFSKEGTVDGLNGQTNPRTNC